MSFRTLPVLVAHADWSTNPQKRWIATANLSGTSYRLSAPQREGEVSSLLRRLSEQAGEGALLVGFDFPIGLPSSFAKRVHASRFLDLLPELGNGDWAKFYEVAVSPTEVFFHRPFYPYRSLGASHAHLTKGLEVTSIRDLLRLCEKGTSNRGDACPLFWTLGPKQVGRAAIAGWRDVLTPTLPDASLDVAVWPFNGFLDELLQNRQCIVAETYPAEACVHLGMRPPGRGWSKQNQSDRRVQGQHLVDWVVSRGVFVEDNLENQISIGFEDGDDAFDAVLGLMSMIEVLLGYRSEGAPSSAAVRDIEGWILGQIEGVSETTT